MKAAISTACLYPQLLETAVYDVCSRGAEDIEIFINTQCELGDGFLKQFKSTADSFGTRIISIHPFTCGIEPMMLFTEYERRVDDMLEYYKQYFQACNYLGADIFVLHGNKPVNPVTDELYFERFARLSRTGREFGVRIAQENVERCTSRKLSFLKKMADYLGNEAKFILDTKQAIRSGEDIMNFVDTLGNKIIHIHFSDNSPQRDCMKYGDGTFDCGAFFDKLDKVGFDGAVTLELYRRDFIDADDLVSNYFKLKNAIDNRRK